ncbi:hypothetical protein IV102_34175 [bacterium]|nr:hypothetical protein [bacterium]
MKAALAWLLALTALAGAQPQRKLVFLRSQGLSSWAESDPSFDFTCYLPRRYTLRGLESQLIQATASSGGLPARLLGTYAGDQVQVAPPSLRLEPPLLPLSLTVQKPWRGVVALSQGGTRLALVPEQWTPCFPPAGAQVADGLYQLTAWSEQNQLQLQDLVRLGEVPAPAHLQGPLQAVVSEGFVQRTLDLYRTSHPSLFRWQEPGGRAGFELSTLGLTTVAGSLRSYASLSGQWGGVGKLVEGEWEAPLQVSLSKGYARLKLDPQGQSVRLVRPFFAEVPQSWADAVNRLTQRFFSAQLALPVPGAYLQPLLQSGLVTEGELDQLQFAPSSWGDRRSSCLILTAAGGTVGPPLQLGWTGSDGFALGLSAAALNRSLAQTIPARLPMRIDLPRDRVAAPRVLIFKLDLKQLEVQQLNLTYLRGAFRFDPMVVAVAWQLGPLSGLEPGARVSGWAVPQLENGKMSLKISLEQFEFLSPHILEQSSQDQERLRSEMVDGLQRVPVPLPVPLTLLTQVHPTARLQMTQLHPRDEALWLVGHWADGP